MSRGGRGASTSTTGVRAIANVLGIARQDVGSFMQLKKEPPPDYPPLNRQVVPLHETCELSTTTDLKMDLLRRFHDSPYYLGKRVQKDVTRYTDKKDSKRREIEIDSKLMITISDFSRLPTELNWRSLKNPQKEKPAKIRKLDDSTVAARLDKLEAAEKVEPEQEAEKEDEDEPEENEEKKGDGSEEEQEISDDDYLEEDNDYAQNYFDNGEGYGDSDDNLEEDHTL